MLKIKQLIIGLLIPTISFAAHAVTLNDALISTYKTNSELNAQRETLKASDEAIMQAVSRWTPSITANATKRYDKSKKSVTTRTVNGDIIEDTSRDGKSHSLTITQNLFRGGADIASIKSAKAQIEQARAKLDTKEQEIFIKSVEVYMNTLARKKIYHIRQIKEKDNVRLLTGTRHRFKAGDASKTEVSLAEAELASARSERSIAQANYETSKANFKSITGMESNNLTLPDENLMLPKTMDETIDLAIAKNPQVLDVKSDADVKKYAIGIQRGGVLPKVELQHTIADNTRNVIANNKKNYTTLLQLEMPLFAVGEWSQLRKAKREASAAQNSVGFIVKTVRASATQAWVKLLSDRKSLLARKAEFRARKLAYEGAKAQEKAGLISTLDIISYQKDYFTSHINFISARSTYYISLYTLKSIVGECTAKGLRLATEYYDPLKNYNSIKWQLIGAF